MPLNRPLTARPRAHWGDTAFLLLLCITAGITQLAAQDPSQAADAIAPDTIVFLWSLLLTVGSLITLAGVFWKSPHIGFAVEFVGRAILCPASLAYGFAIVLNGGLPTILAASYVIGFGVLGSGSRVLELGATMGFWRLPRWEQRLIGYSPVPTYDRPHNGDGKRPPRRRGRRDG